MSPKEAAMIRQLVQAGIPPSQAAEIVFDAISQESFYILTHPDSKRSVQLRMEDLLQERMPTDVFRAAQ